MMRAAHKARTLCVALCALQLLLGATLTAVAEPLFDHDPETMTIDIMLASDRYLPAAATLNSVCANTATRNRLRFHIVVPGSNATADKVEVEDKDEDSNDEHTNPLVPQDLLAAVADACESAEFVTWTLPQIEEEVERIHGAKPMWMRPEVSDIPRDRWANGALDEHERPYAVRVDRWDDDAKHSSPFNHVRFYFPEILRAHAPAQYLLLLDDDVIVQRDVLKLVDNGERLVPDGKALGAGCSHWASVNKADMSYSSDMSYLEVPYFGFGSISPGRPLDQATCHRPGQPTCVPPGFLQRLGEVEANILATLSSSVARRAWRQAVAFAQDYLLPARSVYRPPPPPREADPTPFAEAMGTERAWNFGFVLVDLDAWAEKQLTRKYELWLEANARDQWWPSSSLAFGLGIPFLALRGSVQCFEDHEVTDEYPAVVFEQGFGVVSWSTMKDEGKSDANLDAAFALHFNGNGKPWDAERCLDLGLDLTLPEQVFVRYAKLSPSLFEKREQVKMSDEHCGRRLYGHTALNDDDDFDDYADAYTWAKGYYAIGDETTNIKDCVESCANAFDDGIGTLACPRSDLEMELLQDIFWKPDRRAWIGLYRVDSCSQDLYLAGEDELAACTSWNQCSTGNTTYQKWEKTPDNGGEDCAIDVKCSGLKQAPYWGSPDGREKADAEDVEEYDKMVDQACASDAFLPETVPVLERENAWEGNKKFAALSAWCLCENTAPASDFTNALDDLVADSPGRYRGCNEMTISWRDCVDHSPWFGVVLASIFVYLLCVPPFLLYMGGVLRGTCCFGGFPDLDDLADIPHCHVSILSCLFCPCDKWMGINLAHKKYPCGALWISTAACVFFPLILLTDALANGNTKGKSEYITLAHCMGQASYAYKCLTIAGFIALIVGVTAFKWCTPSQDWEESPGGSATLPDEKVEASYPGDVPAHSRSGPKAYSMYTRVAAHNHTGISRTGKVEKWSKKSKTVKFGYVSRVFDGGRSDVNVTFDGGITHNIPAEWIVDTEDGYMQKHPPTRMEKSFRALGSQRLLFGAQSKRTQKATVNRLMEHGFSKEEVMKALLESKGDEASALKRLNAADAKSVEMPTTTGGTHSAMVEAPVAVARDIAMI